jgi:hypothetical protein
MVRQGGWPLLSQPPELAARQIPSVGLSAPSWAQYVRLALGAAAVVSNEDACWGEWNG